MIKLERILSYLLSACLFGLPLSALATKELASCHLLDKAGEVVVGVNTNERFPIASVSKLFTSYWALTVLGANHRYETGFHIATVDKDTVDMHVQGSHSPYFGREQLQYIVGQLNKLGVKKIRNLLYDEKFSYLNATRGDTFASSHYPLDYPGKNTVKASLESFFENVSYRYSNVKTAAKNAGMTLPDKISMEVKNIQFQSHQDFLQNALFRDPSTRHLVSKSVPLHILLKEMNRNSNNYAANMIFEDLGGATVFNPFIQKAIGVGFDQAIFYNGSGDSFELGETLKVYNSASCQAVLSTVSSLKKTIEAQHMHLEDIVAVAGRDSGDEDSTLSGVYENDTTDGSLLAKTGTVDPAVTLAGVASTDQGDVYFGYIYKTNGARGDQRAARSKIKSALMRLFSTFGGNHEVSYTYHKFMSFDAQSALSDKPFNPPPPPPPPRRDSDDFARLFQPNPNAPKVLVPPYRAGWQPYQQPVKTNPWTGQWMQGWRGLQNLKPVPVEPKK